MRRFNKRTYGSFQQAWGDILLLFRNRGKLRPVMKGDLLSPAFRERLMIVVSGVNDCRYCSYFHASEGLKTGLNQKELAALLVGSVEACPPQEAAALLYAQHWAESNGNPDREARQNLVDNYGGDTAEAIELVLRAIRMGNLMGNTWDYLLYRISFGHWGA